MSVKQAVDEFIYDREERYHKEEPAGVQNRHLE